MSPDIIICPNCGLKIYTEKTVGLSDEKVVSCARCHGKFTLAVGRQPAPPPVETPRRGELVMAVAPTPPQPQQTPQFQQQMPQTVVIQHNYGSVKQYVRTDWSDRILSGVASMIIPGAGQFYLGKPGLGAMFLLCSIGGYFMCFLPGLVFHGIAVLEALLTDQKINDA